MESGTALTAGQMAELHASVVGAVSTALPKVAEKFGDPKAVLKGIKDKTEILAARLEVALEEVLKSMLALIRRPQHSVTIFERCDPDTYYWTRPGLYVRKGFRTCVVAKAKPVEAGTNFQVNEDELSEALTDEQIENGLPKSHLFDESAVTAIIAEMIGSGQLDKKCQYLLYTSSCVVNVDWFSVRSSWDVGPCSRSGYGWRAGYRVLSLAN